VSSRCALTELPADMCSHCQQTRRPRAPAPPRTASTGPTVEARYRGQCRRCGGLYSRGALITRDDDTGGWIAECCEPQGDEGGEAP
jgi:hypothetical protein